MTWRDLRGKYRELNILRVIKTGSAYDWDYNMDNFYVQYYVQGLNHMTIENNSSESSPSTKIFHQDFPPLQKTHYPTLISLI